MKIVLFFLITWMGLNSFGFDSGPATEMENLLCGDKPKTEQEEQVLLKERGRLERAMPPIANQNPASWCEGFAVADLINYHNLAEAYREDPKSVTVNSFYGKTNNLISVIDLAGAASEYTTKSVSNSAGPRCEINVDKGITSEAALIELQERSYKARSKQVLPFESRDDGTPESRAKVRALIAQFKRDFKNPMGNMVYTIKGEQCPAEMYENPVYQNQLHGFEFINSKLFCTAKDKGCVLNPKSIVNYDQVAADLPKDLTVRPYSVATYRGQDIRRYMSILSQKVNSVPVRLSICAVDIKSNATIAGNSDECGYHAVLAVGAYYKGGRCVVRVRNSWGAKFGAGGHMDLPVDGLIKTNERARRYLVKAKFDDKLDLLWLESPIEKGKNISKIFSDDGKFIGVTALSFSSLDSGYQRENKSGFKSDLNNRVVEVLNYPTGTPDSFYTGTVTERVDKRLVWHTGTMSSGAGRIIARFVNGSQQR